MISGVLVAESLRVGASLTVPAMRLRTIRRSTVSSLVDGQPNVWTVIEFEAPAEAAEELARSLAGVLREDGGWYADFAVNDDHVVVFPGRVFRYRKGDAGARAAAQAHGRRIGTADDQLDWRE